MLVAKAWLGFDTKGKERDYEKTSLIRAGSRDVVRRSDVRFAIGFGERERPARQELLEISSPASPPPRA